MSMQDPIADMLTRIRNALSARKKSVTMYPSKQKKAICELLLSEGYIRGYDVLDEEKKLLVNLKYYKGMPSIDTLKRVSKPSLRIYRNLKKLPYFYGRNGVAAISTPQGLMSDREARSRRLGGEVVFYVS